MTVFGGRRKSAPGILLAAVAGFSLLATTAANAVITTTTDAVAFATACRRSAHRCRRRRPSTYVCDVDDPATPEDEPPARRRSRTARWPASRVRARPTRSSRPATRRWPTTRTSPGATATAGTCQRRRSAGRPRLPGRRGSTCRPRAPRAWPSTSASSPTSTRSTSARSYNDAFIAQLDTWSVAADPATQTVTRPATSPVARATSSRSTPAGRAPWSTRPALGTTTTARPRC